MEIVLTPHGFLKKAALAAPDATAISLPIIGASDIGLSQFGRKVTVVSFTMGKYKFNGTINDQNLVELVDTWFPNPMYGDMDYEMRYTKYKSFGGIMFPGQIHVHQGDPRLNPAHNYYEINVTDVKENVAVTPDARSWRRCSTATSRRRSKWTARSRRTAFGCWVAGSHNSVLVEYNDFVAVVEAPQNEGALAGGDRGSESPGSQQTDPRYLV